MTDERSTIYTTLTQRLNTLQQARAQCQEKINALSTTLQQYQAALQQEQIELISLNGRIQEVSALAQEYLPTVE
jgi:uncharacterized phage infection (PIP) family protein YhgE